jgi:hypothetical protein
MQTFYWTLISYETRENRRLYVHIFILTQFIMKQAALFKSCISYELTLKRIKYQCILCEGGHKK